MKGASRFDTIQLSLIRQINALATPESINLGLGEPNLVPDETLRALMRRAAEECSWSYSAIPGSIELRRAIAGYVDAGIDPESELCVTAGSEEALYAVMQAWVGDGDEVLLPDPGFVAYPALATLAGGVPVAYPLDPDDWSIDLDVVKELLSPRTRLMIVNSPSNPTGGVVPEEQLNELVALAEERDFLLLSDEVYREIHYGEQPSSLAGARKNVIVVTSLSKSHGLTGLRIGWIVASPEVMELTRKAHHYLTTCASTYAQKLAELILGEAEWNATWLERARAQIGRQRDAALEGIRTHLHVDLEPEPGGAFYAFAPVPTCDTLGLATSLARDAGVLAIPGVAFGERGEGFLRISYAASPEKIEEGLRRIGAALVPR
jgi:aspartate/methionine/tyrosine aminotransferase